MERKENTPDAAGAETKKVLSVLMSDYAIFQRTGSPHSPIESPIEFKESIITVNFLMIAPRDTHSGKHEKFLCDLRTFLKNWSNL